MTVSELIERLQELPGDMEVVIANSDAYDGYDGVEDAYEVTINGKRVVEVYGY